MTILHYIIIAVITIYAGMNIYLYVFQRNILYLPVKELVNPENYGMYDTQKIRLNTADNVEITAWHTPSNNNEPVVLYLHGNAGNLGDRTEKFRSFIKAGMGLFAVSWRGYGDSDGSPTEEGLYQDARAAIRFLLKNGHKESNIVIYGESLGTGVAVQMSLEYKFLATVLEAPYTSISNRAAELYPYIPVKLLLKDHYKSKEKIPNINSPVLIFHGYLDTVMPIAHGRKMLEAAKNPKEARFFDHIGHADFDLPTITKHLKRFVSDVKNN